MNDKLAIAGREFGSRFILGSGKYDLELIRAAVENAKAEIITLSVRRANTGGQNILDYIPGNVTLLPNTSGARNADEAVRIARLARELGCGDFIKVEVIRDSKYLFPDNQETIRATEILAKEGFVVMPYMYPDLNAARDLVNAGAVIPHRDIPCFLFCFPISLSRRYFLSACRQAFHCALQHLRCCFASSHMTI